jgi:hypothetical protein
VTAPQWADSADKHGVPRADAVYAIVHATFVRDLDRDDIRLYIGPEHAQTERELEVLVRIPRDVGGVASVFHVMPLGPMFRRFREENRP